MAFLNSVMSLFNAVAPTIKAPGDMWQMLILNVFSFVVDYGWRIVVFTVLLKLVLSPLDFFQRYKMRKNQRITERLKPTMDKLQKQYGNDKQAFSRAQMELNRKEGYSYFSSCLPMIATMVIFITLWISMRTIASYMTFKQYIALTDGYMSVSETIKEIYPEAPSLQADPDSEGEGEGEDGETVDEDKTERGQLIISVGQDVVERLYYEGLSVKWVKEKLCVKYNLPEEFTDKFFEKMNEKPSFDYSKPQQAKFLWIENIWAPDVPWNDQAILDWNKFSSDGAAKDYSAHDKTGLDSAVRNGLYNKNMYNKVMGKLLSSSNSHRKVNGYLILPILVLLLSVGSQLITTLQQKRAGQINEKGGAATSMKVMMFIMPALMLFFSLQYASIFTLYMAVNSATSLLLNLLFTSVLKLAERSKAARHYGIAVGSTRGANVSSDSPIIHYVKGANPNAGAKPVGGASTSTPEAKKGRAKNGPKSSVMRSGRPDPNELMNIDMTGRNKKK